MAVTKKISVREEIRVRVVGSGMAFSWQEGEPHVELVVDRKEKCLIPTEHFDAFLEVGMVLLRELNEREAAAREAAKAAEAEDEAEDEDEDDEDE